MSAVEAINVSKKFGDVVALDNLNIKVDPGEFFTLLGPSGCGKSTLLRCIAGLEKPDKGEILMDGTPLTSMEKGIYVPPEKRGLSMVFQSYAIWPHLTAFDNVAFGLKIRKLPKDEIQKKVKKTLDLVNLPGLEKRYAAQLSGGQQQRVALARSLVLEPKVLLLDEPLSNLDAKLRELMRFELTDLLHRLRITSIYVTHDQAEALILSDRLCVMSAGRSHQIGSPMEIYVKPRTEFVADFIGASNLLKGKVEKLIEDKVCVIQTEGGITVRAFGDAKERDTVTVSIRPETLRLSTDMPGNAHANANVWKGKINKRVFIGNIVDYRVLVGKHELRIQSDPSVFLKPGAEVYLQVAQENCSVLSR